MSDKNYKLFSYFNETLKLIEENNINEKTGKAILQHLESEVKNKKDFYSYIGENHFDINNYWYNFLLKTDDDALDYLKKSAKKDWNNKEIIFKLIDRFLQMPTQVKKEFYKTNLVEHKIETRTNTPYVSMCGKHFGKANPNNIFHNLPSIFLLNSRNEVDYKMFDRICKDMKETLNISQDNFLDTYGTSLVFCLNNNDINKSWYDLEIDKRRDLQEVFATKFYNVRKFNKDSFLANVENGTIPFDLKLPVGKHYLMNDVISQKIDEVSSYLASIPFSEEEFSKKVKETKDLLINLNKKYDLYFLNPNIIDTKKEIIIKNFNYHHKNKIKELRVMVETDILDFTLSIESAFVKKESAIKTFEKKIKI